MWKLFYPLRYLFLINSEKRLIENVPTVVLAACLLAPFLIFPRSNFFGGGGFVMNLLLLTAALTGFYVAALVAAATFNLPDLDKKITEGAIYMRSRGPDGKLDDEQLTRREFTTMMFGFLALSAMGFTIFGSASVGLGGAVPHEILIHWPIEMDVRPIFSIFMKIVACVWICHLFVVTCLGLYYLMDRLYHRELVIITPKPAPKKDRAA